MSGRFGRSQYFAFGILPVLNVAALLIYGLEVSTSGSYGEGETIPVLVVLAGLSLLLSPIAGVKRGRDLGWSTFGALGVSIAALAFVPVGLLMLVYLACAKGQQEPNMHGPVPQGLDFRSAWLASALFATPWIILRVLARIYEL
jgi:uncharacterized membrane protein YhaH (DUF805 family)